MMRKRLDVVIFLCLFVFCGASLRAQKNSVLGPQFKLLPIPKNVELLQGAGLNYNQLTFIKLEGLDKKPVLDEPLNNLKENSAAEKGTLVLKIGAPQSATSDEAYTLEVKNGYVTITAKTPAGIFYGAQTLSQLMQDSCMPDNRFSRHLLSGHPSRP